MPATATILKDSGPATTRNIDVQWQDEDGIINRGKFRLSAGVGAQVWADSIAEKRSVSARRKEMQRAIQQCIDGTDPADVERVRIALPKLWETMTRRLYNKNGDAAALRGLAQWVINRGSPAIRDDLNGVHTLSEVNALKLAWQDMLDVSVPDYVEIGEDV